mmetsp:Transcript_33159/g.77478  ORF Transcript_33159/g.77478 Transcript_33159/m.77478 type:complete len:236 (-) Transcript_33159:62-769(-)
MVSYQQLPRLDPFVKRDEEALLLVLLKPQACAPRLADVDGRDNPRAVLRLVRRAHSPGEERVCMQHDPPGGVDGVLEAVHALQQPLIVREVEGAGCRVREVDDARRPHLAGSRVFAEVPPAERVHVPLNFVVHLHNSTPGRVSARNQLQRLRHIRHVQVMLQQLRAAAGPARERVGKGSIPCLPRFRHVRVILQQVIVAGSLQRRVKAGRRRAPREREVQQVMGCSVLARTRGVC